MQLAAKGSKHLECVRLMAAIMAQVLTLTAAIDFYCPISFIRRGPGFSADGLVSVASDWFTHRMQRARPAITTVVRGSFLSALCAALSPFEPPYFINGRHSYCYWAWRAPAVQA